MSMSEEHVVFEIRLKIPLRTRIRLQVTRRATYFFAAFNARLAAHICHRGLSGARFDIQIRDGRKWYPIVKAEKLLAVS